MHQSQCNHIMDQGEGRVGKEEQFIRWRRCSTIEIKGWVDGGWVLDDEHDSEWGYGGKREGNFLIKLENHN